jgi:hypothetical protein
MTASFHKRWKVWKQKTNLTPPLLFYFIEVPVSSQEDVRSCICVLVVSILVLDFGYVPTV